MHIGGDINGTKARFSGIVTAANVSVASSVTAGTFYGDVSNATGFSYPGGAISTTFNDNVSLYFGTTDNDLQIVHDGGNSVIRETGTGGLYLQSDHNVLITKEDGSTVSADFNTIGSAVLYHNGTRKFSTEDYGVQIGDGVSDSSGELRVAGDITAFYSPSDENQKDNIVPIPNSLDKVISISGNTFTWKEGHPTQSGDDTGVVAQQVEALGLPGVVRTKDDGFKSVQYHKLVPLLIEAIKELKDEIDELKKGK